MGSNWPEPNTLATGQPAPNVIAPPPVASAPSLPSAPDKAALAAHYSAGGFASVGYQPSSLPSAPLVPANWSTWDFYVRNQLKAGRRPAEVLGDMQRAACPEQPSYSLMNHVVQEMRKSVYQELGSGIGLIGLGVVVTLVTMNVAESAGGGTYLVMYGPVLAGAFMLLQGVMHWLKLPR